MNTKKTILFLFISIIPLYLIIFSKSKDPSELQIVVTNDSHSQIEASKGMGGFEARARVFDSLLTENPNTIFLDAGDMFQGSPYFNLYFGRVEIEGYNLLGYDAVTLGNHEFDHGIDTLAARISEMQFPALCANYDTKGSPLEGLLKPYAIIQRGDWKVGVIGIGVNPKDLILETNYRGVKYGEPIDSVNKYADLLKNDLDCDVVIVLSHLGYEGKDYTINTDDYHLISNTRNVDLLLGGHTHAVDSIFYLPNVDGDTAVALQSTNGGKDIYVINYEL